MLCERRAFAPPGICGGADAARGVNLLVRSAYGGPGANRDSEVCNVGGKNTFSVTVGDRLQVCTPGGGGFGAATDAEMRAPALPSQAAAPIPVRESGSVRQWAVDQETG